jgi:hypothetical protein
MRRRWAVQLIVAASNPANTRLRGEHAGSAMRYGRCQAAKSRKHTKGLGLKLSGVLPLHWYRAAPGDRRLA